MARYVRRCIQEKTKIESNKRRVITILRAFNMVWNEPVEGFIRWSINEGLHEHEQCTDDNIFINLFHCPCDVDNSLGKMVKH